MFKIIFKIILKQIIFILSFLIPIKKNTWFLCVKDGGGSALAENVLALCYYLKSKKIIFHYVSNCKIKKLEKYFINYYSYKYFYYLLTSNFYVIENDLHNDLPCYRERNTIKINLFHGLAAKKIYFSSKFIAPIFKKNIFNSIKKILLGFCYPWEYDVITTSNSFHQKKYIDAFKNKNVFITGNLRNDLLFNFDKKKILSNIVKLYPELNESKKIVSYMPTFRDKNLDIFNKRLILNDKLNEFLKKNNFYLIIKSHTFNYHLRKKKIINKFSNIIIIENQFLSQELLSITDCLITDYSGIYFDYLFLKRPIIFYCYDYNNYLRRHRELYYNYFDKLYTPGDKAFNINELIFVLKKNLIKLKFNKLELEKSKKKFQFFFDGKNSERLYKITKNTANQLALSTKI